MQLIIIIPAFNPPKSFNDLLNNIRNITNHHILIIDDGSKKKIVIHNSNNMTLLRNKQNLGKGKALLIGFKYAFNKNYTHAITMDCDSQHSPISLIDFINFNSNISLVYGARVIKSPMPWQRIISNLFTSKIISFLFNYNILDSQCGYRRYKLEDIINLQVNQTSYQLETELLIYIIKKKLPIEFTKTPTIYDSENSYINPIYEIFNFIKTIIHHKVNNDI